MRKKLRQKQRISEELHDEAIIQSDLTDDEYQTIAFEDETAEVTEQEEI